MAQDQLHLTLDPSPHPMRRGKAAQLAPAALQLTAIPRREFAHNSGGKDELVAKGGGNGAASFEEGFEVRLGGLLETEDGLTAVLAVGMAARQESGLGNPHLVLVAAYLDFRNWNNHCDHRLLCLAAGVK